MKLVTYKKQDKVSCGILSSGRLIDIPSIWQWSNPPRSVKTILERGPECIAKLSKLTDWAEGLTDMSQVQLLAPIPYPGKVMGLAGNYTEHIKEAGLKLGLSESGKADTVPRPFLMPASVVTGPDTEIPWPLYSEQVDYEIELGVVIGKTARCVMPGEALGYVGGYTIVNDISARSVTFAQNRKERPWDDFFDWLNGKWSDGFLPMGPYMVVAEDIGDVQNLDMELKVNGQTRQKANTSRMIYPVADIVSFVSHMMTLNCGDIIATGTPAGVAAASGDFLKPGDTIECTIDKLGTLTNTLGQKPEKLYTPLS